MNGIVIVFIDAEKFKIKKTIMKRIILAALFVAPLLLNAQEKPLKPEQVKKENAATAIEEKEVAAEKSEAEIALAEGKEIVVKDTTQVYSATSLVENSGFGKTVAFDGAWKVDLNLDTREVVITGGTINNMQAKPSGKIMLTVYFADKQFDTAKPEMIGQPFGQIEVEPLAANDKKVGQSYIAPLALETPPTTGNYYPYIVLGVQDPATGQFGVIDVKVFKEFISLP